MGNLHFPPNDGGNLNLCHSCKSLLKVLTTDDRFSRVNLTNNGAHY